jgi:hypothetical protein
LLHMQTALSRRAPVLEWSASPPAPRAGVPPPLLCLCVAALLRPHHVVGLAGDVM